MYHHNFKTSIAFHFVKDIHKQVEGGERQPLTNITLFLKYQVA